MPEYNSNRLALTDILGDYGLPGGYRFERQALNAWAVHLGGTGGHHFTIDALNEIAVIMGGTGGHQFDIDAYNEISGILGGRTNFEFVEDALSEISDLPVFGGGADEGEILGSLFSDADAFATATVSATFPATGDKYDDDDTFYSATITATRAVAGAMFADSDAFFSSTVANAGGPSWSTVWNDALADGTDNGWGGFTYVQTIGAARMGAATGQTCRVTVKFAALGNGVTVALYVGQRGAGDRYDFNTTPAHVLFSGGDITGDGSTLTYVSDSFSLPEAYDETKDYNFAFQFGAGTVNAPVKDTSGNGTDQAGSYKAGADAATVDKSGYLNNGADRLEFIAKVEVST